MPPGVPCKCPPAPQTALDREPRDQILAPGQPPTIDHALLCLASCLYLITGRDCAILDHVDGPGGGIVLNEVSQTERDRHRRISLTCGTPTHTKMNQRGSRNTHRYGAQLVVARGGGRGWRREAMGIKRCRLLF